MSQDNPFPFCQQRMFDEIAYEGEIYLCEGTPDRVSINGTLFAVTWNKEFLPYTAKTVVPASDGADRAVTTILRHRDDPLPRVLISLRNLYQSAGIVTAVSLQNKNKCSLTLVLSKKPKIKRDTESFQYYHKSGQGISPYEDVVVVTNIKRSKTSTIILLVPDDFSQNPRGMTMEDIHTYHKNVAERIAHGFMPI